MLSMEHAQPSPSLEATFFRTLNGLIEPAVRAGWGSPCISPSGLIVLETTGRRTGHVYRTPVIATLFGGRIFVSTIRGQHSQWLQNLAATPALRYWLAGRPHDADAIVFTANGTRPHRAALPSLLSPLVPLLELFVNGLGFGVAVLTPRPPAP